MGCSQGPPCLVLALPSPCDPRVNQPQIGWSSARYRGVSLVRTFLFSTLGSAAAGTPLLVRGEVATPADMLPYQATTGDVCLAHQIHTLIIKEGRRRLWLCCHKVVVPEISVRDLPSDLIEES